MHTLKWKTVMDPSCPTVRMPSCYLQPVNWFESDSELWGPMIRRFYPERKRWEGVGVQPAVILSFQYSEVWFLPFCLKHVLRKNAWGTSVTWSLLHIAKLLFTIWNFKVKSRKRKYSSSEDEEEERKEIKTKWRGVLSTAERDELEVEVSFRPSWIFLSNSLKKLNYLCIRIYFELCYPKNRRWLMRWFGVWSMLRVLKKFHSAYMSRWQLTKHHFTKKYCFCFCWSTAQTLNVNGVFRSCSNPFLRNCEVCGISMGWSSFIFIDYWFLLDCSSILNFGYTGKLCCTSARCFLLSTIHWWFNAGDFQSSYYLFLSYLSRQKYVDRKLEVLLL